MLKLKLNKSSAHKYKCIRHFVENLIVSILKLLFLSENHLRIYLTFVQKSHGQQPVPKRMSINLIHIEYILNI